MAVRRKATIVVDELKQRHTSHWDLDVLTQAQLEQLYRDGRAEARARRRRQFGWILALLLLLCLYPTLIYHLGRLWTWLFAA